VDKERLNAFTDGVMAVIITIMVLELKAPHDSSWPALSALWPVFLSYVVSFVYVGIYWNNHHHLMHPVSRINGRVMWSNLHLLFWLSLFPWVTSWAAETNFAPVPVALYGFVLLMAACAWPILQNALIAANGGPSGTLGAAVGADLKGKVSIVAYLVAMGLAFVEPWIGCLIYAGVGLMWFIPDRRIESKVLPQ
jgi:uncharacterized membrane protein